jgi:hypothetical protein
LRPSKGFQTGLPRKAGQADEQDKNSIQKILLSCPKMNSLPQTEEEFEPLMHTDEH